MVVRTAADHLINWSGNIKIWGVLHTQKKRVFLLIEFNFVIHTSISDRKNNNSWSLIIIECTYVCVYIYMENETMKIYSAWDDDESF